jgi:flavodoxin
MKPAVVYFSRTNNTKHEAEMIGDILGVKAIALKPKKAYTDEDIDWQKDSCRANKEQNDPQARPAIETVNLPDFDTLFLGYPTWWGIPPRLINTFVEKYDLKGKTVIPFTTSGSTPAERGGLELKKLLPDSEVKDAERVNNFSLTDLKKWIAAIHY